MFPMLQQKVQAMAKVVNERFEIGGNTLHLTNDNDGNFEVWLNTEVSDFDGLIIGAGYTRQAALLDAAQVISRALVELLKVIE